MHMQRVASPALILLAAPLALADYTMSLQSGGRDSVALSPGSTFGLEVWLSSDSNDVHDSAIWQVAFSAPGLIYQGYQWSAPYETGSIFDDSKPFIDALPVVLDADTLAGGGYADGVVDLELANVTMQGTFGEGWLATLTLAVPLDYAGPTRIDVLAEPDTFSMGFTEVATAAVGQFVIQVVPTPPTLLLGAMSLLGLSTRRRD